MTPPGRSPVKADRGLSPVVGTVVLVAIAVLLATLAGAFLMGVGVPSGEPTTAVVELSYDDADDQLLVHHRSGEELVDGTLVVRNESAVLARYSPEEFGVGETLAANASTATLRDSERVKVVWNPAGASRSGTLLVETSTDTFGDLSADASPPTHRTEIIYAADPSANVTTTHVVQAEFDENASLFDGVLVKYDRADVSDVSNDSGDIEKLGVDTDGDGDIDWNLRSEISSTSTLDDGHTLRIDIDEYATEYEPRVGDTVVIRYSDVQNPSAGTHTVNVTLDYESGDPAATGELHIEES